MKRKTAVIIGGNSGIGKATARKFLKEGYSVVIVGTNVEKSEKTKQELDAAYPGMVSAKKANVADSGEVKALAEFVENEYGVCDALVNCAGTYMRGNVHETSEEDYNLAFNVNVKGTYNTMKYFIPMMLGKNTSIVNVASLSGIRGDYNAPLYSASKAAVINLTRAAAMDYALKGIRVNAVSPSSTDTPMFAGATSAVVGMFKEATPNKKIGLPEEVAEAIYFLSSDSASHILGQNLSVDGGVSAWNGQPDMDKAGGYEL